MYTYPLKFEFPMISIGRQVDVKNGDGRFIMRTVDKFIAFKDEMTVVNGKGETVFQLKGVDSFRILFEFTSSTSTWDLVTNDGKRLAYVDEYWARMEEFKNVYVESKASVLNDNGTASLGGVLGNVASNMANNMISSQLPSRLTYRVLDQHGGNIQAWIVPSRGDSWFNFLPYSTRREVLRIPLMARFYTPSYEVKFGNLYAPTSLVLRKQRDLLVDKYLLEKTGDISDAQESWLIPVLTLVTMFERTRVRNMAD